MTPFKKILIALFALITLFGLSTHAVVVDLTASNFDSIVQDPTKTVFVKFFAPWCGHCKNMAPAWVELSDHYNNRSDIVIAEVDATKQGDLASKFGVRGYPTLRLFTKDDKKGIDYSGPRTVVALKKFLEEKVPQNS